MPAGAKTGTISTAIQDDSDNAYVRTATPQAVSEQDDRAGELFPPGSSCPLSKRDFLPPDFPVNR